MPLIAIIGTLGAEAAAAAAAAPALAAAAVPLAATAIPSAAAIGAMAAPTLGGIASAAPALGGMTAAELAGGVGANAGLMSGEVAAAQAAGAGAGTGITAAPTAAGIGMAPAAPLAPAGLMSDQVAIAQGAGNTAGTGMTGIDVAPGGYTGVIPQGGTVEAAKAGEAATRSAFQNGINSALKFTKDYPILTSVGLNVAGSLLTPSPSGPTKKKYGPSRDLSGFQRSTPSTVAYNPSYISQGYAVGGPVEEMAAQNAAGANTTYPQAGLQTPMYANPQIQRPMATNVISPSGDIAVDPYTGEQKFASGGNVGPEGRLGKIATDSAQLAAGQPRNVGIEGSRGVIGELMAKSHMKGRPMNFSASQPTAPAYVQSAYNPNYDASQGITQAQLNNSPAEYDYMYDQLNRFAGYAAGGNVDAEDTEAAQAAYNRKIMGIKSEQEKADTAETLKAYNAKGMSGGKGYSKTQQSNSPFTAANKEYAALAKKYGIPVAPMAKTSIDLSGSPEEDFAAGGIAHGLGGYSDGGRLLKGPGDGVSDSIPAVIGNKQPARLADGEFVIPARIVSELGNGSTEAGARQLYAMMERIQKGRKKSIGKDKVAVNSKASKHLPK